MPITKPALTGGKRDYGRWAVYVGDAFTAGGLVQLGVTEGDIDWEPMEAYRDLTLEEYTGAAPHDRAVVAEGVLVTVPLIIGPRVDAGDDGTAIYDKISALGDGSGGGFSTPQDAVETNLLLIPEFEVGAGLSYDGVAWSPAAPKHARWIWRAVPEATAITLAQTTNEKVIVSVPFRGLYADARPEGHKLYTVGNPVAAGITTVRI